MVLNLGNVIIPEHPSFYNVKDFGAVGDNVTNDWGPITAANLAAEQDGGGTVYFPPLGVGANDRYRIESPLYMREGVSWLGGHAEASRISAHGAPPNLYSIVRMHATVTEEQGFFINNLSLGFQAKYNDIKAKVIDFNLADPQPKQYMLTNLILRNGYYGYHDVSTGFLAFLSRVSTSGCKNGFYKQGGGTGHQFYNCYAWGSENAAWDSRGWDIGGGGVVYVLTACGAEKYHSNTNGIVFLNNLHALTINGFALEECRAEAVGNNIVNIAQCFGVFISGMKDITCRVKTGGGTTELVRIYRTRVHLDACELGGGTTCNGNGGAGIGETLQIEGIVGDLAEVTVTASAIVNMTAGVGPPVLRAIALPGGANTTQLTVDNVFYSNIWNPNNNKVFVTDEISVGIANSGGAGFRLLRVPNAPDTRFGPLP